MWWAGTNFFGLIKSVTFSIWPQPSNPKSHPDHVTCSTGNSQNLENLEKYQETWSPDEIKIFEQREKFTNNSWISVSISDFNRTLIFGLYSHLMFRTLRTRLNHLKILQRPVTPLSYSVNRKYSRNRWKIEYRHLKRFQLKT